MPARPPASLIDALTSLKGAALLVPAILLVGATLALGQSTAPSSTPMPQPYRTTEPAAAASSPAGTASSSAFTPAQRKELESHHQGVPAQQPEMHAGGPERARSQDGQDPGRAHGRGHQGERRPSCSGRRPPPSSATPRATCPVIEFFDYNCGYCKKALSEVSQLIDKDKKVRLILKEFPILSKGSEEASRVALAAKMQGKYWEFHRAMLENQGQANEASALRVAEKLGLDMARLKKDMASAEVKKEIDDTRQLANQDGHPGHAALHRRRPHHRRARRRT